MRDLGFDEIVSLSLVDPGAAGPAAARPDDDPRRADPGLQPAVAEHSELRTTLLGSPARRRPLQPRPRRRARRAVRVRARLPREGSSPVGGPLGGRVRRASGRRRRSSRIASPPWPPGPLAPPSWGAEAAAGRLLRAQGRARGAVRRSSARSSSSSRTRSRSSTRAARRASCSAAGEAGWLGEMHPLVCRDWDLDRAARVRGRPRGARGRARRRRASSYEDVTTYPVGPPGPRGRGRRGRAGRAVARGRASRAAASCCAAPRSSTCTAASRSGEGRKSLALRLEFRAPDRTLTDDEVAERAAIAAIEAALGRDRRDRLQRLTASRGRVLVAGASGLRRRAGGAARLAPPAPRARGRHRARRRGHPARRALSALPGPARARGARPASAPEELDAAIVAYPHGAAAPRSSRAASSRRARWWTSPPTSGSATWPSYERWYGDARRAGAAGRRGLRAPRAPPRGDRAAPSWSPNPGCYPTAALLALAPLAAAGLIGRRGRSAPRRASPAPGGARATRFTSSTWPRTSRPTASRATATRRRSSRSCARRRAGHLRTAPGAHSTRGCWRAAS